MGLVRAGRSILGVLFLLTCHVDISWGVKYAILLSLSRCMFVLLLLLDIHLSICLWSICFVAQEKHMTLQVDKAKKSLSLYSVSPHHFQSDVVTQSTVIMIVIFLPYLPAMLHVFPEPQNILTIQTY